MTYSRPVAVLVGAVEALVIPYLELPHAEANTAIRPIVTYSDDEMDGLGGASSLTLALDCCATLLNANQQVRRVGYEPHALSVRAFQFLSERVQAELVPTDFLVERRRAIKDPDELSLMRQAAALAQFDLTQQARLSRPSVSELEVQAQGDARTLIEAAHRLPECQVNVWSRPIAGPRTAHPHAITSGRAMVSGDLLIYSCGVQLNGYWGGVERTMFLGQPKPEWRPYFDVMHEAQGAALATVRPGITCGEVDAAARQVIEAAHLAEYMVHRTGHGIGLSVHEFPSFARNDRTVLEPGMVMSIEPGLYVPGLGGFRHEDNVLLTEEGAIVFSDYPSDWETVALDITPTN